MDAPIRLQALHEVTEKCMSIEDLVFEEDAVIWYSLVFGFVYAI
ncbi:MAG: hypothetical protein RL040_950 [Bacteroidota bacterium]|jgi:hypothetical protein